jgi:hypothetical protein
MVYHNHTFDPEPIRSGAKERSTVLLGLAFYIHGRM